MIQSAHSLARSGKRLQRMISFLFFFLFFVLFFVLQRRKPNGKLFHGITRRPPFVSLPVFPTTVAARQLCSRDTTTIPPIGFETRYTSNVAFLLLETVT